MRFLLNQMAISTPFVIHNNKTVFLLTIDIFPHEHSASKRGALNPVEITEEDLIRVAEETTTPASTNSGAPMANLTITSDFLPPDLSRNAQKEVYARMFSSDGQPEPVFNLNVTLSGKIGMVVCWYFDGNLDGPGDFKIASRLVRLMPHLLGGRFEKFSEDDLYCLHDALGSFPNRDEGLEAVHRVVHREWRSRIRERQDQARS